MTILFKFFKADIQAYKPLFQALSISVCQATFNLVVKMQRERLDTAALEAISQSAVFLPKTRAFHAGLWVQQGLANSAVPKRAFISTATQVEGRSWPVPPLLLP